MAADCGIELKKHNITMLSLYPGGVKTELVSKISTEKGDITASMERTYVNNQRNKFKKILFLEIYFDLKGITLKGILEIGETPEFSGKVVVEMVQDPNIIDYSSKVIICAEYAEAHNIKDIDGSVPPSNRKYFET